MNVLEAIDLMDEAREENYCVTRIFDQIMPVTPAVRQLLANYRNETAVIVDEIEQKIRRINNNTLGGVTRMKSAWKVTSNSINGKKVYGVYRIRDVAEVDHSGKSVMFGPVVYRDMKRLLLPRIKLEKCSLKIRRGVAMFWEGLSFGIGLRVAGIVVYLLFILAAGTNLLRKDIGGIGNKKTR